MFDDMTYTPYHLFLGRLPSQILHCERCRSYTLNINIVSTEILNWSPDSGPVMWQWQWELWDVIHTEQNLFCLIACFIHVTLIAICFLGNTINSILLVPLSVREESYIYTTALIYSHLDVLLHVSGTNDSPCCVDVCVNSWVQTIYFSSPPTTVNELLAIF